MDGDTPSGSDEGARTGALGAFLRARRARIAPGPEAAGRRRTPGLRREEVAARAGVSVTWYTWLEQGRGGAPSAEVLERLARALALDEAGREMLFLLAQQRPPTVRARPTAAPSPAVQAVLDGMVASPALVKTPTWDVVAWNAAAAAVLTDYAALPPGERNALRLLFGDGRVREHLPDWEAVAAAAVGVFRVDVARMGGSAEAEALAAELRATNADFRRLWAENEARGHGDGLKRMNHPVAGPLNLHYAAFAVDGADGLTMVVYTPASAEDAAKIQRLVAQREAGA